MPSIQSDADEPWVPPGNIALSPRVVSWAREFIDSVNGQYGDRWIVGIDWATSCSVKDSPQAEPRELGPGLSLGAYERHQVPPEMIDRADGLEFALHIPREMWEASAQRLIEFDESLLFKLKLV